MIPVLKNRLQEILNKYSEIESKLLDNDINIDVRLNLKKRLKQANKISADYAIIIGDEEIQNNNAIIRNLETGSQEYIELDKLVKHIEKKML